MTHDMNPETQEKAQITIMPSARKKLLKVLDKPSEQDKGFRISLNGFG